VAWGPGVRRASSDGSSATFQYLAGSSFLCGFFSEACPDIARAGNGDTIEITGIGILTIHPKSVGGGGTFKHKNASGNVLASGTWTAQELISFVPYLVLLPDNIAGGQALIRVHLSTGSDVIVDIDCEIGAPPGQTEAASRHLLLIPHGCRVGDGEAKRIDFRYGANDQSRACVR
jgi:hypothetical protein